MISGNFLFGSIRSPPERTQVKTTNLSLTIKLLSFPRMLQNVHCQLWIFGRLSTQILVAVIFLFSFAKACDAVPVSYTLCLLEILSTCSRYASALPARNKACMLQIHCASLCFLPLRRLAFRCSCYTTTNLILTMIPLHMFVFYS